MQLLRNYFAFARRGLFVVCGYLYVWIILVNCIGYFLFGIVHKHACFPYITVFGVFAMECPNRAITFLFNIFIGIPRVIVTPLYLSIRFLWRGIEGANPEHVFEGLIWLLWATPFFIIAITGFRYWRRRSRQHAWAMTTVFSAFICYLGFWVV